jgi:transcriptional regulator with XRE-family HTH domain
MGTLADRLRKAVTASGLSQSEIGRRVGVSSQTINQWLSGKKKPTRDNLVAFCQETHANIGWLLYGQHLPEQAGNASLTSGGVRGRLVSLASVVSIISKQPIDQDAEKVFANFPCGPRSQAFVLPDDSNAPEHPVGTIWIVDPDERPTPGDMVLAVVGDLVTPVFGRFRVETSAAGRVLIVAPLNGDWPAARSDIEALEVVAVMTEHSAPRRTRS